MSDMLAVEQETNNDVRQFLNKINELRNKAPKNEETKHEEHTPDHYEAKQQEQAWRGNLRYLDTLNRLDEVLPRKLYERWEKEHTVNDEAVLRALCYFAGTGKNSQLGWCRVLAHVTTQIEAIRRGAPGGLIFQSICGSEKGLKEFGVELAMLDEARAVGAEFNRIAGENCLYFETGQGSALSAGANFGADQVTMEARNYGLARHYDPFIVNTVVGFIGPEYLYNDRQIIRAGLEDHFMGKLSGISMGCDCCYTNHADADQNLNENLMILLATAGCNYIMGMPLGDDIMLNYQTTAFHDTATVRQLLNLRPSPEFERWLESMGIMANGRLTKRAGDSSLFF